MLLAKGHFCDLPMRALGGVAEIRALENRWVSRQAISKPFEITASKLRRWPLNVLICLSRVAKYTDAIAFRGDIVSIDVLCFLARAVGDIPCVNGGSKCASLAELLAGQNGVLMPSAWSATHDYQVFRPREKNNAVSTVASLKSFYSLVKYFLGNGNLIRARRPRVPIGKAVKLRCLF